jgi:hypothetical protein
MRNCRLGIKYFVVLDFPVRLYRVLSAHSFCAAMIADRGFDALGSRKASRHREEGNGQAGRAHASPGFVEFPGEHAALGLLATQQLGSMAEERHANGGAEAARFAAAVQRTHRSSLGCDVAFRRCGRGPKR